MKAFSITSQDNHLGRPGEPTNLFNISVSQKQMKRIRAYGGTFINREVLYTSESHLDQRQIQEIRQRENWICLIPAVFLKLTLYGRYIDDCISATSALPQRYLIYQRGAHSLYNRRQFLSPGSEIYPGNFRNFFAFLDVKISNKISSITFKLSW